jgi:hypothetical protein
METGGAAYGDRFVAAGPRGLPQGTGDDIAVGDGLFPLFCVKGAQPIKRISPANITHSTVFLIMPPFLFA